MRYTYDDEADALYVHLQEDGENVPVVRSIVVDEGRVVDLGAKGEPVGIELLAASAGVRLVDLAERFGLTDAGPHLKRLEQVRFRTLTEA